MSARDRDLNDFPIEDLTQLLESIQSNPDLSDEQIRALRAATRLIARLGLRRIRRDSLFL